ncbi:MAG: hypothetical protein HRU09_12860 [Oligoflexales bacterium]|nr:hypothetical protein [Oligoflexales bacterium]
MLASARSCVLVFCLIIATQALSKPSYDTLVMQTGRRWFSGSSNFLANEVSSTLFYEIEGLSLAMGGGFSFFNIQKEGLDVLDHPVKVEGAWGYEVSLEAKLWLPESILALPYTPYIIYAHDLFSDYEIKGRSQLGNTNTKSKACTNGYKFNLGLEIPFTKTLMMNIEYSLGSQSIKHKYNRNFNGEVDEELAKKEGSIEGSLESQAFLLGIGLNV